MMDKSGLPALSDPVQLDIIGLRRLVGAVLLQAARDASHGEPKEQTAAAQWLQDHGEDWASIAGINFYPAGLG